MTDTGTRTGIVYLQNDGADSYTLYRSSIRNVVATLEAKGALFVQQSATPTPGVAGRFFKDADDLGSGVIYYDNGTTLEAIGSAAPTDGSAATPSLRTLGSGATQASAGNHTHAIGAITGAGDAAAKNVGTTTGTVAAGDHTHTSSALYVYKPSDTVRSTVSLTADPDLSLTLGVGTWRVEAELAATSDGVTGDFAMFLAFSGTATTRFGTAMLGPGVSTSGTSDTTGNYLVTGSSTFGMTTNNAYVRAVKVLVVTASGAATVNWAQASVSGATTLRAGSHLIATRLE